MTKRKKPDEPVSGSYTPIPHMVLDSVAFKGLSYSGKSLLFDILRQHTGFNNGHLQLYTEWLYKRGWKSAGTIQKAKEELLERGLIVKTRWGGFNAGADFFALTWLVISNYSGLDITRQNYLPGAWTFMDRLQVPEKRKASSELRNGSVPESGIAQVSTVLKSGTERSIFGESLIPRSGNNECLPLPADKTVKRVVGRKGRSGISRKTSSPSQAREQYRH